MSSLRTLLQNADPLRHEAPRLEAVRDRIRRTVVGMARVDATPPRRRLRLVTALAVVVLTVVAVTFQFWPHGSASLLAAVRFEVRLAEDRPIPGLIVAQVADSARLIYLHPEVVVNNEDVAQSWVLEDVPAGFGVAVQLLPSGAERMRQATRTHVGRPIAILIDGAVALAPIVRSPIGDSAVISGNYSRAEAERIAEGIGRR